MYSGLVLTYAALCLGARTIAGTLSETGYSTRGEKELTLEMSSLGSVSTAIGVSMRRSFFCHCERGGTTYLQLMIDRLERELAVYIGVKGAFGSCQKPSRRWL